MKVKILMIKVIVLVAQCSREWSILLGFAGTLALATGVAVDFLLANAVSRDTTTSAARCLINSSLLRPPALVVALHGGSE